MKKVSIKVITVLLAMAVLLGVSAGGASALNYSNNLELHSEAILLVSMDTGQTVFEKNADKKMYPASTTKIMTFIVAFENIKDVKNTSIEIKQSVLDALAETGSSMANLSKHVGEKVSVTDLFYSLYVYTDMQPFYQTLGVLVAITAIFALAAALLMRRQRYASL